MPFVKSLSATPCIWRYGHGQQASISNPISDNVGSVYLTCVHDIDNYTVTVDDVEYKVNLN